MGLYVTDTSVVQVKATDMDFDNNAKIGYVLYSGGRDNFIIDYYTGLVQVAPRANLDIERFGQQYTMIVCTLYVSVDRASEIFYFMISHLQPKLGLKVRFA